MLEQVQARSGELAVRFAHGANLARLTQQLIIEALLIATAAGAVGLALAWSGFRLLAGALPLGAWAETTRPDWTLFASATALAVIAALLVVIVPMVSLWRGDLRIPLSGIRTGGLQGRGGRLENGLVVAEVALAVLIASGAALLARSVAKLYALDPGVAADGVGVVDAMVVGRSVEEQRQNLAQLTDALARMPGVRSAGAAQVLPLRGGGYNLPLAIEGRSDTEGRTTEYRIVTPGYLETMGFELLAGRTISDADRSDSERVVVINQALADEYFAGVDPIGRLVGGDAEPARVIGVVANAAERRLTDDAVPVRYVAVEQLPWLDAAQSLVLLADGDVDQAALLEEARRTSERMGPVVAVRRMTTMSSVLAAAVGPARQVMSLLSLLSGLALTLGAVGVYGVIAHFAARRRRDWAIRVALGLPATGAVSQVFKRGARLVVSGVVLGGVAALALARVLSPLLYGIRAVDPVAFAAAATALLAVGLVAAFVPARRAGTIDPAAVLRE
jgi:predicted permease